jgi:hypothetical protein
MVFIEAKKRFNPTYNGPLTYNNAIRDICYKLYNIIYKQNKLIYEIIKSTKIDLYTIINICIQYNK